MLGPGPGSGVQRTAAQPDQADGRARRRGPERVNIDRLTRGPRGRSGQQRDPEPRRDQLADAGRAVRLERDAGLEARGGLVTSAVGLGCMGLSQGYGPADDADSVRAIHAALGLSEATPAQLEQAAAVHPVSAVQFEWSLLWRGPGERGLDHAGSERCWPSSISGWALSMTHVTHGAGGTGPPRNQWPPGGRA